MKQSIKALVIAALGVPILLLGAAAPAVQAATLDSGIAGGANSAKTEDQSENLFDEGGLFQTITNTLMFLLGAVSVIMLVIGGFRYAVSGGDQKGVEAAKNTILYALIGIVVAILGYAAVAWVIGALTNN